MMTKISLFLVACILLGSAFAVEFEEKTFVQVIEDRGAAKLVVFYDASEKSAEALEAAAKAAETISEKFPEFTFFKVDGKAPENEEKITQAKFTDFPYVFVATREDGIERIANASEAAIAKAVFDKLEPTDFTSVKVVETEQDWAELSAKPRFVKFYEEWCPHCRAIKKSWAKAAEVTRDAVVFAEVECSKNDFTKELCVGPAKVKGLPTLRLYPLAGDTRSIKYTGPRASSAFLEFVSQHVGKQAPEESEEEEVQQQQHAQHDHTAEQQKKEEKPVVEKKGDVEHLFDEVVRLAKEVQNLSKALDDLRKLLKMEPTKKVYDHSHSQHEDL